MDLLLFYIMAGALTALFIVDNPRSCWIFMTQEEIIKDLFMYFIAWPFFVAGMIYGFFRGGRK